MDNKDQAASLRSGMMTKTNTRKIKCEKLRCIAIASGKGGVGKSFLSVNLALALQSLGSKTLLFDSDLSLANVDILLGHSPNHTIQDFIFSDTNIEDVVQHSRFGLDFIAAASGETNMVKLGALRLQSLTNDLLRLSSAYDTLIFDCGAGLDENVTSFVAAAPQTVVVLTPEPTSIMDGYALIKTIVANDIQTEILIVLNMVDSQRQADSIFKTLLNLVKNYLFIEVKLLGVVMRDRQVHRATVARKPLLDLYPDSDTARQVRTVASSFLSQGNRGFGNLQSLFSGIVGPKNMPDTDEVSSGGPE